MKPKDFVKEFSRMCGNYKHRNIDNRCVGCPMEENDCLQGAVFDVNRPENFAKAYDIVAKWSDEHPVKTRQSEFLKIFPKTAVRDGVIFLCPKLTRQTLAGTDSILRCERNDCAKCRREYWLAEVTDND